MLKTVSAGVTALFVTASPLAYAQAPSPGVPERLSASDMGALTDARVKIIKAALDLTPDQEKYWPPIENAIRNRAQNRQARVDNGAERKAEVRERGPIEAVRDRNPVEFLHRRAAALAERAADLNKIADAWQPLYQTLSPDQKRRMSIVTMVVFRDMRNAVEHRRLQAEEDEEADY
jgi:LTXXQ motif family protein